VINGKMRVVSVTSKYLLILCIPVMLLSASITWAVNSQWLYEYGFEKYEVRHTTGLDNPELKKAASGLISYFNSNEEFISITVLKNNMPFELFNQREVFHLKDVKDLIWMGYWILLGTLIYFLAYVGFHFIWRKGLYKQRLVWRIIGGSGLTLVLMMVFVAVSLFNFDQLFLQFHLFSFTNDLWLLDPSRDYLIMLFPQGFWLDMAIYCGLAAGGIAVFIGGVTGSVYFFNKIRIMMKEAEVKEV